MFPVIYIKTSSTRLWMNNVYSTQAVCTHLCELCERIRIQKLDKRETLLEVMKDRQASSSWECACACIKMQRETLSHVATSEDYLFNPLVYCINRVIDCKDVHELSKQVLYARSATQRLERSHVDCTTFVVLFACLVEGR